MFALSTLAGPSGATLQGALYVSNIGNAVLHVGWAAKHRRYDPGLASAVLALLPTAVTGLKQLKRDPEVSRRSFRAGIALGAAIGAGMAPVMKLRLNRRLAAEA